MAGIIGGLYDFIVATFGWWNENFTTRVCGFGEMLAEQSWCSGKHRSRRTGSGLYRRTEIRLSSSAPAHLPYGGLSSGHVPYLGRQRAEPMESGDYRHRRATCPEEIFKYTPRASVSAALQMAGSSASSSWGIIKSAVGLAAKEMGGKG